jgi:hypothetical protein
MLWSKDEQQIICPAQQKRKQEAIELNRWSDELKQVHCANCGAAALPGDTSCWQCGREFSGTASAGSPDRPTAENSEESASWPDGPPVQTIASEPDMEPGQRNTGTGTVSMEQSTVVMSVPRSLLLTLVTALLVIVVLALFGVLGKYPLVQMRGDEWAGNWRPIDDDAMRFTLTLPPDWEWQGEAVSSLPEQERAATVPGAIQQAVWTELIQMEPELKLLGVAAPGEMTSPATATPAVMVFGPGAIPATRVETLLVDIADASQVVEVAEYVDDFARSHQAIEVQQQEGAASRTCRIHLYSRDTTAFLVLGCAQHVEFGRNETTLRRILDSFQPLGRSRAANRAADGA